MTRGVKIGINCQLINCIPIHIGIMKVAKRRDLLHVLICAGGKYFDN